MKIKIITSVFLIIVFFASCKKIITIHHEIFNEPSADDIIKFDSISSNSILADSISTSLIHIQISPGADAGLDSIILTTDNGLLGNKLKTQKLKADGNGMVNFLLTSSLHAGSVNLRATVAGVNRDTIINFENSYADTVLTSVNKLTIASSDSLELTTTLIKYLGYASMLQYVSCTAKNPAGVSVGQMVGNHFSDSGGKVKLTFHPNATTVQDTAYLTAIVEKAPGVFVNASISVVITP